MNRKKKSLNDGRDPEHDPKRSALGSITGPAVPSKQQPTSRGDENSQSTDPDLGGEENKTVVNTDEQRYATNRDKIRSTGPAAEGAKK